MLGVYCHIFQWHRASEDEQMPHCLIWNTSIAEVMQQTKIGVVVLVAEIMVI